MATQILVIFLIRTAGPAWTSWPHPVLVATSLGALAIALAVALSPIGPVLGFTMLGLPLMGVIAGLLFAYLICAEVVKPLAIRAPRRRRRKPVQSPSAQASRSAPRRPTER